jgi:hypothetical protein
MSVKAVHLTYWISTIVFLHNDGFVRHSLPNKC